MIMIPLSASFCAATACELSAITWRITNFVPHTSVSLAGIGELSGDYCFCNNFYNDLTQVQQLKACVIDKHSKFNQELCLMGPRVEMILGRLPAELARLLKGSVLTLPYTCKHNTRVALGCLEYS